MNGQSAIGFKPNNPGQVAPGQTFLLGAIRHNNLPIGGTQQIQQYLHSSLNLQLTADSWRHRRVVPIRQLRVFQHLGLDDHLP